MTENGTKKKILSDICFITTVYNEEKSISEFLGSIMEQTCLPGEIIIVDGGSEDCTFKNILDFFKVNTPRSINSKEVILKKGSNGSEIKTAGKSDAPVINVRIIKKSGANISQGRNEAIKNARGSIICVSDAGCILDKNWLVEVTGLYNDTSCDVVGGLNIPYCKNFIQKCLAVCIMPLKEEIKDKKYMPSSRNISFKKKIWADVGGYPENLDYGEDMKFNFNIKDAGYRIKFNPAAIVYWKMRESPVQIFRQFFRYSKGDAAGGMYPYRHIIRFASFLIFIIILSGAFFLSRLILFVLVPLFIIYVYRPYSRLIKASGSSNSSGCCFYGKQKLLSILFIPFLLLQIDFSKMLGYAYGLFKNIIK